VCLDDGVNENLKQELKQLVVESLKLDDVTPDQIEDGAPLFGQGLGLDSIDALELAVAIERRFKVSIPDEEVGKQAFRSIDALAEYVAARVK
jgi:acyl carrier protein